MQLLKLPLKTDETHITQTDRQTDTHARTCTHAHTQMSHIARCAGSTNKHTHTYRRVDADRIPSSGRQRGIRAQVPFVQRGIKGFGLRYLSPYPYSGLQRRTHSSLDFIVTMPSSHPLMTCPTPTWRRTKINILRGGQTSADHAVAITVAEHGHCCGLAQHNTKNTR
jgi:hypothetical protein